MGALPYTMTQYTTLAFTTETKIGEIVAAQPSLARVFESLGLDYCCGGKQTLAAACARKSLDASSILGLLEKAATETANAPKEPDPSAMTLSELADHIENTHHLYVKRELPRLLEMAERVALKHAWKDGRLPEVYRRVGALTEEMIAHMNKEEKILFPLIRDLESGAAVASHCGFIGNPIRQMETEHESAGSATERLRSLTDGFVSKADDCNTHRALLAGLLEFEGDLHRHVHKENNILFPRALSLAAKN